MHVFLWLLCRHHWLPVRIPTWSAGMPHDHLCQHRSSERVDVVMLLSELLCMECWKYNPNISITFHIWQGVLTRENIFSKRERAVLHISEVMVFTYCRHKSTTVNLNTIYAVDVTTYHVVYCILLNTIFWRFHTFLFGESTVIWQGYPLDKRGRGGKGQPEMEVFIM
jgi:hypothetical protein